MDRNNIFAGDSNYTKTQSNARKTYEQSRFKAFGYVDYVNYSDYITQLVKSGEIDEELRSAAALVGQTPEKDSEIAGEYIQRFTEDFEARGYTVVRLEADKKSNGQVKDGGQAVLYATRDKPLFTRVISYFTGMFFIDNIHYVPESTDIGERGLTFTLYDPLYGGEKFSPAIIGNGTKHKYLLYFDSKFPWFHQNFLTLNLGESYTVNRGIDVFETMTASQGTYVLSTVTYPTGHIEESADDLHTATYAEGSLELSEMYAARFTDDYTNTITNKGSMSKLGYSFVIGIISTIIAYVLGLPLGILMARFKNGILDKFGTIYICLLGTSPSPRDISGSRMPASA